MDKIHKIVQILKNNECFLSDGYKYYLYRAFPDEDKEDFLIGKISDKTVDDLLVKIAEEILAEVL